MCFYYFIIEKFYIVVFYLIFYEIYTMFWLFILEVQGYRIDKPIVILQNKLNHPY